MKDNPNILVIRFRRVGDAVLSSTLCTSLKKTLPNSTIHYVLNDHIAPLFANHDDIDKVIPFSDYDMSNSLRYLKKVWKIMHETKYDIIIDTRSTVRVLPFAIFSLNSKYRIGRKKLYNYLLHNYRIDNFFDGFRDHVTTTLELLDPLIIPYHILKVPDFKLYVTQEEKIAFGESMAAQGISLDHPIMICAVAARLQYKMWDSKKVKEVLIRVLNKYPDLQLVFNFGGETERQIAQHLHNEMDNHPRIFSNIEATNLREVLAMFANSNFFFGNEGGPRHIAQALNIPSLAIYPPYVSKKEWLPNPSEIFQGIEYLDVCPQAINKEMSDQEKFDLIDVEFVWDRLDMMLQRIYL